MHDVEEYPQHAQNKYMMPGLTSTDSELYRVQQKVKKQQLTLMNMWKK
jgi:hypothetical protein